jgi:hypothetical protein
MRSHTRAAVIGALVAVSIGTTGIAATAGAKGRPQGRAVSTTGVGTLGSHWKLKSMHDDDLPGAPGAPVAGEEFEIEVAAGHTWTTTFANNGVVFFSGDQVSTAAGIREVHPSPGQRGNEHMTVHAVDHNTGETIDGFVDLPALR